MAPLAPTVVGPVSECSSTVRVQGQFTNATVELFVTGQAASIGGGTATWSDQVFPLHAGVTLPPGQTVWARQTLGGQTSPPLGPAVPGVTVQKKPPSIGTVAFKSHLYQCGTCVWLVGAVPGAEVVVTVGGSFRGSTVSADGNARIGLNQAIGPTDILTVQQTACGTPGPPLNGPHPDPAPAGPERRLPAPVLPGPLKQCDPAVLVTGVSEGATVTLTRSAAPPESACFDATALWFGLSTPLMLNETVTAVQNYPHCKVLGTPTAPATVGSVTPVPPPAVKEPLCAGQPWVTLTDYQPGARIEIFQDHVSLGSQQAPDQDPFSFPVAPLTAGAAITARQTLCNVTSVDSNAVHVDAAPQGMPTPVVPGPLYACSSVVHVENLHIGARVHVYSTFLGAEIGQDEARDTSWDVHVAPLLIPGDHIYAAQIGCGHTSHNSAAQHVQPAPALNPPHFPVPLDDCMTAVPVSSVVPGAWVDIFVNDNWRGGGALGTASGSIPISGRLQVKDTVSARQSLCGRVSENSSRVGVIASHAKNWPMYHHDPQHTGLAGCSDISSGNVASLTLAYPAIALGGHVISVPAIVDGKVYVGSSVPGQGQGGGTMYRIDLATGNIEQQFSFITPSGQGSNQSETGIGCTPAVVNGKVYFSGLDGKIRCLDASSFQLLWTTDLRNPSNPAQPANQPVSNPVAETWSSPLVVNGRVYVGAGEGESGAYGFVYCLDAGSGSVIWLFCTNQFAAGTDNQPNVVPAGATAGGVIPPAYHGFTVGPEPLAKGASVWSSCAYHPGLNRVFFCTGNPDPDAELPNTRYSSGIVSLDAGNGTFQGFFQATRAESYRPDDSDVDVPAPPLLYSMPGQDVVAYAGKNGAAFLLDPATMNVLAHRQLLPTDGSGNPLPTVDVHQGGDTENKSGVFAAAAIDPVWGHVYFGLGGYAGVDQPTTPFMRICYWDTLEDAWPTVVGSDTVTRYSTAQPPMYRTREAGLSSPVVVNDVVLVATSLPALYAFSSANGIPLWIAPGFPQNPDNPYCLGPAIYGDYVLAGVGQELIVYKLP